MKKVHIAKGFTAEVNGRLRTEEQWLDIFDWREEREKERQEAEMEADMVRYNGYMVSSLYAEEMTRY